MNCDQPNAVSLIRPALVAGLGSAHGDDQIGWLVCAEMKRQWQQTASGKNVAAFTWCFKNLTGPVNLLTELNDAARLIIVDACRGGGMPGELRQWIWPCTAFRETGASSTHGISLTDTLQMASTLGLLPSDVVIWTVEIPFPRFGSEMTPQLRTAVSDLAEAILASELASQ